jgi:hypothetical protein
MKIAVLGYIDKFEGETITHIRGTDINSFSHDQVFNYYCINYALVTRYAYACMS